MSLSPGRLIATPTVPAAGSPAKQAAAEGAAGFAAVMGGTLEAVSSGQPRVDAASPESAATDAHPGTNDSPDGNALGTADASSSDAAPSAWASLGPASSAPNAEPLPVPSFWPGAALAAGQVLPAPAGNGATNSSAPTGAHVTPEPSPAAAPTAAPTAGPIAALPAGVGPAAYAAAPPASLRAPVTAQADAGPTRAAHPAASPTAGQAPALTAAPMSAVPAPAIGAVSALAGAVAAATPAAQAASLPAPIGVGPAARALGTALDAALPETATPATPVAPVVVAAPLAPNVPAAPGAPTVSAAAASPTLSGPLATQLSGPLFTLAGAGSGEHVLTINVTPDNLGPVTVRAHITGENIRVELFAPTELGRDALRALLPDLRRDLAGSGINAQLNLSSGDQPGDAAGDQADSRGTFGRDRAERDARAADGLRRTAAAAEGTAPSALATTSSTIDVMA